MDELLQFKLYLHIGGKQQEIRRFSCTDKIDIGTLNRNIKEKFPHLGDKEFVVKWEDDEGDKVDISSEQELMLAMKEMKKIGSVYKLHVQILENPWWKQVEKIEDKTSKNCSGEEHPGIICFCCHQQVKGFRYKCVICPNYDMCGSCEDKAMHPAHDMVRIPSPRSYPAHFFLRLHRLYERCTHSSPTVAKPGCGQMSSPNEQMAKDLLEDDSSDLSDLELEVNLLPEGSSSSCLTLLPRKRVFSDPGNTEGIISPLPSNAENYCLLQEQLPSFEELTKSMQDLAEKDLDENFEITKNCKESFGMLKKLDSKTCGKTNSEEVTQARLLNQNEKHLPAKTSFSKVSLKQNRGSINLDTSEIVNSQKLQEISESKSHTNNNEEEIIDTSESLRNIQQEIESLLAPLTPLPDLDPVPKAVKTGDDKEMFVLMNNKNKDFDNEKSRAGSFEIIENNGEEFCKSKSMDDLSLLGDQQDIDNQIEDKKDKLTEETGNESSETESEDQVDSDDDCNGNLPSKGDENIADNNLNDKEKTISECQSGKNLVKDIRDTDIRDTVKHQENSENFVVSPSFKTGGLSGLSGQSSKGARSPSQPRKSVTEPEGKSGSQRTNSSTSGARRHYNPRIADALDNMVGMGFTDDDGWLTQLLEMKHGDISQVLDILTPVKK